MVDEEREKYPSEAAERFQVRLPPGLRDRIKAYAEQHGRSMNSEIVRLLEREFPEPFPLARTLSALVEATEKLKEVFEAKALDEIGGNLLDVVQGIAKGTVAGVEDDVRSDVAEWLRTWRDEENAAENEAYRKAFDEEELENFRRTGSSAKIVDPNLGK